MAAIAFAFWGSFFGTAALALAGAFVFMRSARRVALLGALAVILSASYSLVFLGWVPITGASLQRLQSMVAIGAAAVLQLLLLTLLGTFRRRDSVRRVRVVVGALSAAAFTVSWLFPPEEALEFGILLAIAVACAASVAAVSSARRGERAGWLMLGALPCAAAGVICLGWYALHPDRTPPQVHAISAVAGIAYLVCIATAMWSRYAYLIEVRKVMAHGPNYDPVTWLPSFQAGTPVPDTGTRPVGVIVVSISNLKMLEELHGPAAYNHALFACALRLRKASFPGAELWRLREDAFVFVFRRPGDPEQLLDYSRQALRRLSRPVQLGTSHSDPENSEAVWEPSAGVGVLVEAGNTPLDLVIAGARATSRTAWSYPSRMAWFDEAGGEISELPVTG
ncbi:GGDEF domain-containing protein [Ramlibacter sp. PS4R-6]|uniref:GGDEF domain-containing protein n=1 Tax=Ramlibacter sp. PS4R-6 TaxID=3133438 RepID=UPI0030A579C2